VVAARDGGATPLAHGDACSSAGDAGANDT
jgi:hypothetical protein